MRSRLSVVLLAAIIALGCWSCNGCPRGATTQTLAFNQSWPPGNGVDVAASIRNGTAAFTDANISSTLQPTLCAFFADLAAAPAHLQANGDPGDPNFNFAIAVFNMQKSGAACPSNSPSPIEMLIAPSRGLALGQTTTVGDARFVVGSTTFSTARGYFEFTLTTFDRTTGRAVGSFQAIALNDSNPQDTRGLVITGGSFSPSIP